MKIKILPAIGLSLLLTACGGSNNPESISESSSVNPVRQIVTLEDFNATIVDKSLQFRNDDGSAGDLMIVVNSGNKILNTSSEGEWDIDWFWDGEFFCRSGTVGLPGNATTLELDCQVIDLDNDVVNFVREMGAGGVSSSYFIR